MGYFQHGLDDIEYRETCFHCGCVHRSIGRPVSAACRCGRWVSSSSRGSSSCIVTSGSTTTSTNSIHTHAIGHDPIRHQEVWRAPEIVRSRVLNLLG